MWRSVDESRPALDDASLCRKKTIPQSNWGNKPHRRGGANSVWIIFTARRYASAVYAVIVCLSVCPSACLSVLLSVSVASLYCIETIGRIERDFFGMEASFHLSHTVLYGNSGISKNKDTSLWNFVRNSGLRKFRHGKSMVLSTILIDGGARWRHLGWSSHRGCLLHVGQL